MCEGSHPARASRSPPPGEETLWSVLRIPVPEHTVAMRDEHVGAVADLRRCKEDAAPAAGLARSGEKASGLRRREEAGGEGQRHCGAALARRRPTAGETAGR